MLLNHCSLQDPNTEHLGTSVWDASIVLAKYLEKVLNGVLCVKLSACVPFNANPPLIILHCPDATKVTRSLFKKALMTHA